MIHNLIEFFQDWGVLGLIIVAFTESSFFIIPPDALLIPLSVINPSQAILYAVYTTAASVVGGIVGYYLGKGIGKPLLHKFASEEIIEKAERLYDKYGTGAIIIAGFTPIPYKVFTILSGAVEMNMTRFIIGSIIGRGSRFILVASFIMLFGEKAIALIQDYGSIFTLIVGVVFILIFVLIKRKK
ncbi:YqaA family protein [Bacillus sp. FJAT-47783]|uniref:YqaA family protein n=1 Tax=Bacillus sp. FJAT-47783 TaxID=2922712 RepID=UPI001FAE1801|nr:YqaA family protein [Bacillus sp. FJAT-47783]